MELELEILKVLIDNQKKIIKNNGWSSHKIYRNINNHSKEEVKIALASLCDRKLVKITLVKNGDIKDYVYRINDNGIKFYNKESEKMVVTKSIEQMINDDLEKLDNTMSMTYEEKKDFYIELTSKYNNMINNFGNGLYGYYKNRDFYDEDIGQSSIDINFKRIKSLLISFKANGFKNFEDRKNSQPIFNNNMTNTNTNTNTNITNINMSFEEARKTIQNMDNLNDNELEEILSKIDEIETIVKSKDTKRNKWKKLKTFLTWVADKGVDVATALLPLFLGVK